MKDGVSQVVFEGAGWPAQELAVREYDRIIRLVTGAEPAKSAPNRIAFAVTPDLGTSDTYEIRVENWKEAKTGATGKRLWLVGNNERSCWFAMCDLLEQLGCRWFWDGAEGEYLPAPTRNLALADPATKTTAAFPWRNLSSHPNHDRDMWYAHNRLNTFGVGKVNWGQTTSWGGHSFNWIRPADCKTPKEYFEKYPEQWAEMDGVRVDGNHCYTNPDTIKTFQEWILRFWETHPDMEYLTLTARDSPVYCHCATCEKVGDSSTLFFDFLNKITAPAIKKYPAKRYRTCAYAFYSAVPKVRLNDHFRMEYCMYDRCYKHLMASDCPANATAKRQMQAWKEALGFAPDIYGYHFDTLGGGWKMYIPLATVIQDDIKWARDFGVTNWKTEFYGGYPDNKQPRDTWGIMLRRWPGWAAARLMWNPDLDLAELRKDFCDHVYGKGGTEVAEYFRLLDEA